LTLPAIFPFDDHTIAGMTFVIKYRGIFSGFALRPIPFARIWRPSKSKPLDFDRELEPFHLAMMSFEPVALLKALPALQNRLMNE
jgi:hypothetical protein